MVTSKNYPAYKGQIRFEAEWVSKQHVNGDGEWNPDLDEYSTSHHSTKEAAVRSAITGSKTADQCEWIMISQQRYNGYVWIDINRWTGDWDGIVEETYTAEEV